MTSCVELEAPSAIILQIIPLACVISFSPFKLQTCFLSTKAAVLRALKLKISRKYN
jgi:hypothetical protein